MGAHRMVRAPPSLAIWFFRVFRRYVSNLDNLFGPSHTTENGRRRKRKHGVSRSCFKKWSWSIVQGGAPIRIALEQYETAELGPADSYRVFHHGIEHRL